MYSDATMIQLTRTHMMDMTIKQCSTKDFNDLHCIVGRLASAFANTTLIEAYYSILKWEKSKNQASLTDLSLGGVFQAKQHNEIISFE
jgi:hypothetical protein